MNLLNSRTYRYGFSFKSVKSKIKFKKHVYIYHGVNLNLKLTITSNLFFFTEIVINAFVKLKYANISIETQLYRWLVCFILDFFVILQPKIIIKQMITKEQVESFLEELHTKMKIFGILFRDDREKNRNTLQELEIVPSYRKVVVENLRVEDYVQGPVVDELNRLGEMWVFGKDVKERNLYKSDDFRNDKSDNLYFFPFCRASISISF